MTTMSERRMALWTPEGITLEPVVLPAEVVLCVQVNGTQLVSIAASPTQQEALVLGFLHYAGLIRAAAEVRALHFSYRLADSGPATRHTLCADVWLDHDVDPLPDSWMRTSGCGSGVVLGELREPNQPLAHQLVIAPHRLIEMRQTLQAEAVLYQQTRGTHASGLFTPEGDLLALAEDIGRHNTLDKLLGLCLLHGIKSEEMILFTTGRISSEMMSKAAWMRTPFVSSMTAPSSMAVTLAESWGITTVGYVRAGQIRIYAHPWRLLGET